jgi:hypothetical protein
MLRACRDDLREVTAGAHDGAPDSELAVPALHTGTAALQLAADGSVRLQPQETGQRHDALMIRRGSEEAVHAVHVAAGNVKGIMVLADRLLIRAFQEAIDLAVGVVVELNLPHAELVGGAVPRSLGYLVDGILRQLEILVEIHEPSKAAALGAVSWAKGPGVVDVVLLLDGLM